jgi:hypothetical protein
MTATFKQTYVEVGLWPDLNKERSSARRARAADGRR